MTGEQTTSPRADAQWDESEGVYRVGLAFASWEIAVRAHIGRLLAYALREEEASSNQQQLIEEALAHRDLPMSYRGCARTLSGLNGKWAVPGTSYAQALAELAERIKQA